MLETETLTSTHMSLAALSVSDTLSNAAIIRVHGDQVGEELDL